MVVHVQHIQPYVNSSLSEVEIHLSYNILLVVLIELIEISFLSYFEIKGCTYIYIGIRHVPNM